MIDLVTGGLRHWLRLTASGSPTGRVFERDGVVAAIMPAAPERAVVNSVIYSDGDAFKAAYDELAGAYGEIGAKWTVWVRPGHDEAAAMLERAGHVLDAQPEAMVMDLAVPPPRPTDLEDWSSGGDMADVGPINDRSYPFGTDSFTRAFRGMSGEGIRVYTARVDGVPAASTTVVDHEGNTEIQMVAVVPEARGRGLAGKLLAHALADAAERGMETSTLVATKLGRPVYDRLGYRAMGAVQMWEWRPPASVPRGTGGVSPRIS
jgi:ribosomal protein S18 acetylase RimI-like enzyme